MAESGLCGADAAGPADGAARGGAGGLWTVLRRRDFALLWGGQSVSLVGDGVFTVALALETLRVDRSPAGLSFVLAARLVPAVCLMLIGGVVVDRIPRRVAMLASDAARAAAVGVLTACVAANAVRLWQLIAMSAVFGVGDAVFAPASTAIMPEVAPPGLLVQASSLNTASQQFARMAGPALGGLVLAAAGYSWAFGLNAASFVVSAACLGAMTSRPGGAVGGGARRSALAQAREGLRYCWSQRWLWVAVVGAGIGNFAAFNPLAVLVPLLVKGTLRQGPLAVGLVVAAGGAGGGAASLIVGRLGAPRRRVSVMWLAWTGSGAAVVALSLAPDAWTAGACQACVWGLMMVGNVLWLSLMQERVPPRLLGRAASVDMIVSFGLSPLGVVAAGVAAGGAGPRAVLLAGGCLAALSGLLVFVPGARDPERADAPLTPATGAW